MSKYIFDSIKELLEGYYVASLLDGDEIAFKTMNDRCKIMEKAAFDDFGGLIVEVVSYSDYVIAVVPKYSYEITKTNILQNAIKNLKESDYKPMEIMSVPKEYSMLTNSWNFYDFISLSSFTKFFQTIFLD